MKIQGRKAMPCRPFALLDALFLVGAAAVGFAGCRAEETRYSEWYYRVQMFFGFFLALASWLVLILRLRRPRPSIRLIARQPGAVACFGVAAVQLVQFAESLASSSAVGEMGFVSGVGPAIWTFFSGFDSSLAAVVPISWALLVANRRWRPEPGWIDRSGRLLGWTWIAWMVVWPIFYWLAIRDQMHDSIM